MDKIKLILGASILLLVSVQVNTALISQDDNKFGADSITFDTNTGLEWLDLNITQFFDFDTFNGDNQYSYNEVIAQLDLGGEFEGFRIATEAEVESLIFENLDFTKPTTLFSFNEADDVVIDELISFLGFIIIEGLPDGSWVPQGVAGMVEASWGNPSNVGSWEFQKGHGIKQGGEGRDSTGALVLFL